MAIQTTLTRKESELVVNTVFAKTGDVVSAPDKRIPFFKVGKRLRELVNT